MTHVPRKEFSFYQGYHSWSSDLADGAFNVEWANAERAPNGHQGWFYTDTRDGYARGPFTSSREAFRSARLAEERRKKYNVDSAPRWPQRGRSWTRSAENLNCDAPRKTPNAPPPKQRPA